MSSVSLVLVAHRSSACLAAAIAAFRREATAAGVGGEVVIVEQSEDAAELARVAALRPDLLIERPNRGYAAGVNAGVERAGGEVLLVGNPDVELLPGALAPLLGALAGAADVAGPQFELDAVRFPPAEPQTPWAELHRRLGTRSAAAWQRLGRSELARSRAVWEAGEPRPVPTLSGALLAFHATLAARIGPWDEDYFLYFEETDWLLRARRAGARLAVVPQARATHRWGHAARPGTLGDRFDRSRARYFRRWFPLLGPWVLRVGSAAPAARAWSEAPRGDEWRWLVSPLAAGFPAALMPPGDPEPVAAAFAGSTGLASLTMVAWRDGERALQGPFAWTPASSGAAA